MIGRASRSQRGTPSLYSPHCFAFATGLPRPWRMAAAGVERALGRAGGDVLCVCQHERQQAIRFGVARPEQLHVVYNGCEPAPQGLEGDPALLRLSERGPVVGAVAALREQKRLDLLVDAVPLILAREFPTRASRSSATARSRSDSRRSSHGRVWPGRALRPTPVHRAGSPPVAVTRRLRAAIGLGGVPDRPARGARMRGAAGGHRRGRQRRGGHERHRRARAARKPPCSRAGNRRLPPGSDSRAAASVPPATSSRALRVARMVAETAAVYEEHAGAG